MNRKAYIDELRTRKDFAWDLIIIGGGATGMGIALDGASRGYSTILFEQNDFGSGTSSRSTKLVHGGVRYMAQGDLLLVMEALHERGIMLKNAPHVTAIQEFVIPVFTWWDAFLYTAGLKFYDLLSGKLSIGRSSFISREEAGKRIPQLTKEKLKGGVVYCDGQFDDARMILSLADAAAERKALLLNYFSVEELVKNGKGKITGIKAVDSETREEFIVKGRAVINAAGVFADNIHKLDDPHSLPTLRPSQGIHLVLDRSFLDGKTALMIPKTPDGRVLFAIPWYDVLVVGTTDTPLDNISLEPKALDSEITFILDTAAKYLVRPPSRKDILSIFAGLRPLAADAGNPSSTKEVSRRHKITVAPSGLLSIIGGKWTTYRRMAEEIINTAIKRGLLEKRKCNTYNLRLVNSPGDDNHGRLKIYAHGAQEIMKIISDDDYLGKQLDDRLPYTRAEYIWICRNEMPLRLEDLLARRTRALLINARASLDIASEVAAIMGAELGYDHEWQKEQVRSYNDLVKNYLGS